MLHKTPICIVQSPYDDTDLIDIATNVLHRGTLVPYLFVIYIDYLLPKTTNNNKNLELHNQKLKERNSA